jgi:hypothetical protein
MTRRRREGRVGYSALALATRAEAPVASATDILNGRLVKLELESWPARAK